MAQIIDDLDGNSIIPTDNILPDKLLLIPLQSRPIFPGIFTPLMINAPDDVKVVEKAYEEGGFIGIVLLKNDTENPLELEIILPILKEIQFSKFTVLMNDQTII